MMDWNLPYPSRRQPVLADNVVTTSQPLATQAGLEMLRRGGNAVDAAVAAAISLTVVEPTSNGIGGDAFALVWHDGSLHGLNASGRAPGGLDAARLCALETMPLRGWDTVTVPGAVSAWQALAERFGELPFDVLFEPAVRLASDGFLVSPVTAAAWAVAETACRGQPDFAAAFLPAGRAPRAGERFALPDQATTLAEIAETGGTTFYEGRLAERIAAHAAGTGGHLGVADLASHAPQWVEPLPVDVGSVRLHELPPNGQGLAALIALGILEHTPARESPPNSPDWLHWQIEAMKLAFADVHREVADPDWMQVEPAALLEAARLADLAARIDPGRAGDPGHGRAGRGGTVYLAAADAGGTMVSFIQSNYHGFGSGVVVPGTGIALHNRGAGFSTVAGHPNVVAPGKRPFHTIIPGFVTDRSDVPVAAFGVMGGPMQPQGHVQVLLRVFGAGENPQAAIDAPRWRVEAGLDVAVEGGLPPETLNTLAGRGHRIVTGGGMGGFGGAQFAGRMSGGYLAASDPRKDGQAAGF